MPPDIDDILTGILYGDFDTRLEQITEAIKSRRNMIGVTNAQTLKVGDKVKLVGVQPIEAQYIHSRTLVTVQRIDGKNIYVRFPDNYVGRSRKITAGGTYCWPSRCYIKADETVNGNEV